MTLSFDDLVAKALGADARLALASAKRQMWAQGFTEGMSGGASGAAAVYHRTLSGSLDIGACRRERDRMLESLNAEKQALDIKERGMNGKKRKMDREIKALDDMLKFLDAKPILSKHEGSCFHKIVESGLANDLFFQKVSFVDAEGWSLAKSSAHIFVIDHDWASAFKSADIGAGEVRTPYDVSCFEMTLNGRNCCYLQCNPSLDDRGGIFFVQTPVGWLCLGKSSKSDTGVQHYVFEQIRAVCISLDADVAKAEIFRAPHMPNAARAERGELPPFDYHVVSLAKRSRAPALPSSSEAGHHKRLHWRRGHWRHFSTHKTWIKWMLVGDPDLGFVDKHYRL